MTDFGDVTWRHGRKEHRCEWCGEPILVGEKHAHFVGKWEGEFQNWRMHRECYEDSDMEDIDEGFTPYEHDRPRVSAMAPHQEEQ